MMQTKFSESFSYLKRQCILVLLFCFMPHLLIQPLWLSLLLLSIASYQLISDYYKFRALPLGLVISFAVGALLCLYGQPLSIKLFISGFLILIGFKLLEVHTLRDLKVIIVCNFYLIFLSLIVFQELWIIIYLLIALFANLATLLRLTTANVSLWKISGKSSKHLLIAIPVSLLLFFIFPRIAPIWHLPFESKGSVGFNDTMSPGSLIELSDDDSIAMHIKFNDKPVINGYWRGIILTYYNGESWYYSEDVNRSNFLDLPNVAVNKKADYEIILEPTQKRWLFYHDYPIAGEPNLIFSTKEWLIRQDKELITQRFIYSLKVQSAPYKVLSHNDYTAAIQLPNNTNPRLSAWAKENFAKSNGDVKTLIQFLKNYIHQQPFWYTLTPLELGFGKNQMDQFWFDTQKGFCEHYASAVAYILRSAGIPARVILGYYGGQWNPISRTMTIRQSDAHAWLEYWQAGIGWQVLDPTSFVAPDRVDLTIKKRELYLTVENTLSLSQFGWVRKVQYALESVQYFSKRWLLYYNAYSQQNLLFTAGLGEWDTGQLLQAALGCIVAFFILLGILYRWSQSRSQDTLLIEYHLVQKEFQRLNVLIHPSMTLNQQCALLIKMQPWLKPLMSSFLLQYEELRLQHSDNHSLENRTRLISLLKKLRHDLRLQKPT
jgi:transglutaminase-like putative cysteine protease